MSRISVFTASGFAIMLLAVGPADAAGVGLTKVPNETAVMLQRVHSVYEAEQTLYRRGFYDVRLERASLPYSFNACKRGTRYHIHVIMGNSSKSTRWAPADAMTMTRLIMATARTTTDIATTGAAITRFRGKCSLVVVYA
jgi:hypothetical protein